MRALELGGQGLELVERPAPLAGPGQLVVDVVAAGLCHSDLTLIERPADAHPFRLPLVLGHEIAGVVSQVGAGVAEVSEGDPVVVYGPWGCGSCRACLGGAENLCPVGREEGILPPGLGAPGGLAEQVLVPSPRHLVAAPGIDPAQAAPLADAGLTAYSAVRQSMARLTPGATAVVVGVGGLGHVAVQLLKILTACRVVALDSSEPARLLARDLGADLVLDPAAVDVAEEIGSLTTRHGADVVLDFVASAQTLAMSAGMLARGGDLTIVGVGTATLPVAVGAVPLGATVRTPYWGTRQELADVVALARAGLVRVAVELFALDDVIGAYERLREGSIAGRGVVLPGGRA